MRDRFTRNMTTNKHGSRSRRALQNRLGIGAAILLAGFVIATWYSGQVSPSRAYNGRVSRQVVINQVYAGGGVDASSSYQNDFVELLNTSTVSIDISGWSLQERSSNGSNSTWNIVNLCASTTPGTCVIPSGRYYLVKGADTGNVTGRPAVPGPNITDTNMTLSFSTGEVALVNSRTALTTGNPVPCTSIATVGAPAAIDFVGWGMSGGTCFEGTVAPNFTSSQALRRSDVTNPRDTDNNLTDFPVATTITPRNSATAPTTPTASNGVISGRITDVNGSAVAGAVVSLIGRQNRKFITDANGNYRFDNVETDGFYNVRPSRANFNFSPAERSFSQLSNTTEATFTAVPDNAGANPLDTPEYFVRQQYVDVLMREPDENGFNYWSEQILACNGDQDCTNQRRRTVAAAFFIENEFQRSGSFVYDLYAGALGRRPAYAEYMNDRRQLISQANLAEQKISFTEAFVERAEFLTKYAGASTAETFVTALLEGVRASGVDLSAARTELIDAYNTGSSMSASRARVVRALADVAPFKEANYNSAFVLTEYFAYLQRNPDQEGYNFWLAVIGTREVGNYRGMVCAFINSREYQQRFGNVVTHSDSECGH